MGGYSSSIKYNLYVFTFIIALKLNMCCVLKFCKVLFLFIFIMGNHAESFLKLNIIIQGVSEKGDKILKGRKNASMRGIFFIECVVGTLMVRI